MKQKISVVCLLLMLAMVNLVPVSAKQVPDETYVKANVEEMCPEELALRKQLGMTEDTPQVLSTREAIRTGTTLTINSSGYAGCGGYVSGGDDIDTIQIFLYLVNNSTGKYVASWMDAEEDYVFGMARYHQLTTRGTYITKMSAYVYANGTYKNLVRYSHTDTY